MSSNTTSTTSSGGGEEWDKVGAIVAGCAGLYFLALLTVWYMRRKHSGEEGGGDEDDDSTPLKSVEVTASGGASQKYLASQREMNDSGDRVNVGRTRASSGKLFEGEAKSAELPHASLSTAPAAAVSLGPELGAPSPPTPVVAITNSTGSSPGPAAQRPARNVGGGTGGSTKGAGVPKSPPPDLPIGLVSNRNIQV